jgi:hypothetical protein
VTKPLIWVRHDGGRLAAGFTGSTGDCACRAIAIAAGLPYREVYALINKLAKRERRGKRKRGRSNARKGVYRPTMRWLLEDELGWSWTATMGIGTGCKVHLARGEVPATGRHIVSLSKHYAAIVEGKVYDTHDPCREGTRCVYGYWSAPAGEDEEPTAARFKRKLPKLMLREE